MFDRDSYRAKGAAVVLCLSAVFFAGFLGLTGCSGADASSSGADSSGADSSGADAGSSAASSSDGQSAPERLQSVATWMYQIQNLERRGAVQKLAQSNYDMLVVEPTSTVKGLEDFDAAAMVRQLKTGRPGRLVLAYVDIGEAESYRTYWRRSWRPPRSDRRGRPSFIVAPDPDGWEENYPVAYWDRRWQRIQDRVIRKLTRLGFDGIYLDWVEAYDDDRVIAAARRKGVRPKKAMVKFIAHMRRLAHTRDPDFLFVAQNAPYLIEQRGYLRRIDAAAFESTWYAGEADAGWSDPAGGDIARREDPSDDYSTRSLINTMKRYTKAGLPVFTADYALNTSHAEQVYRDAASEGFVPLVTRVSLARMTTTPPPGLGS